MFLEGISQLSKRVSPTIKNDLENIPIFLSRVSGNNLISFLYRTMISLTTQKIWKYQHRLKDWLKTHRGLMSNFSDNIPASSTTVLLLPHEICTVIFVFCFTEECLAYSLKEPFFALKFTLRFFFNQIWHRTFDQPQTSVGRIIIPT